MTMFDARTKLADQVIDEVRAYFGSRVYDTIIPRTVRLSEAPGFGKPISLYDPSSKGALAYKWLAEEVVARPVDESPLDAPTVPPKAFGDIPEGATEGGDDA
jgi:cellulose biosynthesis protein BcsQ